MTCEKYEPVALNGRTMLMRWRKEPAFAGAHDALADEFAALAELVRARQRAETSHCASGGEA